MKKRKELSEKALKLLQYMKDHPELDFVQIYRALNLTTVMASYTLMRFMEDQSVTVREEGAQGWRGRPLRFVTVTNLGIEALKPDAPLTPPTQTPLLPPQPRPELPPELPPVGTTIRGDPACAPHHHRWDIDTANGPRSWGECRDCHDRRVFSNSSPESENPFAIVGNLSTKGEG